MTRALIQKKKNWLYFNHMKKKQYYKTNINIKKITKTWRKNLYQIKKMNLLNSQPIKYEMTRQINKEIKKPVRVKTSQHDRHAIQALSDEPVLTLQTRILGHEIQITRQKKIKENHKVILKKQNSMSNDDIKKKPKKDVNFF